MSKILRRKQVIAMTGLSKTSIYNLEKAGDFPMHFMLTPRCCAWNECDVLKWITERHGAVVASAPAPDVTQRKTRGVRKTRAPEIAQIRRTLADLQRMVDQLERASLRPSSPSVASCWSTPVASEGGGA